MLLTLNFAAGVWGINRLVYEDDPAAAVLINILWCAYHFLVLSFVFYFNNPRETKSQRTA
jgi:cellulose synthase (UDP-forming)